MNVSAVNASGRAAHRSAGRDCPALKACLLSVIAGNAALHKSAPHIANHDGASLRGLSRFASGQGEASGQNHSSNHIHPSDVFCPFNLSGAELQLWRQCRAADRGHQIASRGVSGVF